MKKSILFLLLWIALLLQVNGQAGLTQYSFMGHIATNNFFNPSFLPSKGVYIGLPVLSSFYLEYNNRLNFNNIYTRNAEGFSYIDGKKIFDASSTLNHITFNINTNLLFVGVSTANHRYYQFGIDFRVLNTVSFNKLLPAIFDQGVSTDGQVNKFFPADLEDYTLSSSSFIQTYIGYGFKANDNFHFGGRLKFLNGLHYLGTDGALNGIISIDPVTYLIEFKANNVNVNKTPFPISPTNIVSNISNNFGLGIDLGLEYKIDNRTSIQFAANDIGFIRWNNGAETYSYRDTSIIYEGFNLKNNYKGVDELLDSITNIFSQYDTKKGSFTEWLSYSFIASAKYHISPHQTLIGTIYTRTVLNQWYAAFGVSYRHFINKHITFVGNIMKPSQHWVPTIGTGIVFDFIPMQVNISMDNVNLFYIKDIKTLQLSFGVNFVFNRGWEKKQKEVDDDDAEMGGIYQYIKKKKPNKYWIPWLNFQQPNILGKPKFKKAPKSYRKHRTTPQKK
ncbi:MAG: DUF5723 family protein [Chitinophagaceae bacterium]|nr:DUF5723 family protein [Chitinophagaceae bacterium]